eukprot:8491329-Lingulodinium_polyedra.AAC.1
MRTCRTEGTHGPGHNRPPTQTPLVTIGHDSHPHLPMCNENTLECLVARGEHPPVVPMVYHMLSHDIRADS